MKSLDRCALNKLKNLLAGSFDKNMQFYYCTKDAHSYSVRRLLYTKTRKIMSQNILVFFTILKIPLQASLQLYILSSSADAHTQMKEVRLFTNKCY